MTIATVATKESDVDYRVETIAKLLAYKDGVDMKMHKHIAREWFMSGHADYYLNYIARRRKDVGRIVASPHYVVVEIKPKSDNATEKYYVVGVDYDADMLFLNRVNHVDMYGFYLVKMDRVNDMVIIYTHDDAIKKNVFNYNHDVVEPRFAIDSEGRYRVQGDIVFSVSTLDLSSHAHAWSLHEVSRYIRYLVLDRIAAVLSDYGISYNVGIVGRNRGNNALALIIMGGTDSSRWSKYSARNRARIVDILSKYFDLECKDYTTSTSCDVKLTIDKIATRARVEIESVSIFGDHVGNIEIVVREAGNLEVVDIFTRDIAEQFNNLPKTDTVRQIGNHRIEIYRAIPVRFAYEPRVKPLVLEPQTLYIISDNTYVVDDDTLIELIHKEHGQRHIWFRGKYVLRIERVNVHRDDAAERNRTVLRRIAPYRL